MGLIIGMLSGAGQAAGAVCNFIPNCPLVMLGLRIVVMMFVIGWVRSHLGGGTIATIVMLVLGYLILFHYWYIFGPLSIVYMLILMNFMGVIQDLAFGGGFYFTEEGHQMEGQPVRPMC